MLATLERRGAWRGLGLEVARRGGVGLRLCRSG